MSLSLLRRGALGAALALGLAVSAAVAAPPLVSVTAAHAATGGGSIVYIKNHNVWIADGNGANQRQVIGGGTASKPWRSPTQSDGGVVVATRGDLIYRMNQRGAVYNTINPPALKSTGGEWLDGPMTKVAVSPDGTKIAFMYEYHSLGGSGIERTRWITGVTAATGYKLLAINYKDNPSWVTNNRLVVNDDSVDSVYLADLGYSPFYWFTERRFDTGWNSNYDLRDVEVSRDGQWVVAIRGYNTENPATSVGRVKWWRVQGNALTGHPERPGTPAAGQHQCQTNEATGAFSDPTISPDSKTLAWSEPDGIWTFPVEGNCWEGTQDFPKLTIPGASQPSWSGGVIGRTPADPKRFSVTKAPHVSGKARVGRTLKVAKGTIKPSPSSYRYQWYRNGKAIKKATKSRYKLKRADKRKKISVRVTAKRSGYPTLVYKTKSVRVR